MAKHKLTARRVASLVSAGKRRWYGDGDNLYLQVNGPDRASWVFMTKRDGRQAPIGLGSVRVLDLKAARAQADACRQAVHQGKDPRTALPGAAVGLTFDAAARALIDSMGSSWKNDKHRAQWYMTLLGETVPDDAGKVGKTEFDYCAAIRHKPLSAINTEDVLRVLQPLWQAKSETASRLRSRCERVWDYARARGHCTGQNPFLWRGHLAALLPKRARLTRGHHKAMPFVDVPDFMARLRCMDGIGAKALELTILTALRTSEVLGGTWDELDFQAKVWTVPAARMKMGKEHRVPLSERALAILAELQQARVSNYVFPGIKRGQPLGNSTMDALLRRVGIDVTVHGFRSSFRDWAGDASPFPRDLAEMALAHAVESEVEAAYRRSDALEKRRLLMEAWANYCGKAAVGQDNVVLLAKRGA